MAKGVLSATVYQPIADKVKSTGNAHALAQERRAEGLGMSPLVNPSGYKLIRDSRCRFEHDGEFYVLTNGVAMLIETLIDGTGSMGKNAGLALALLLHEFELLSRVLKRYDIQEINAIFGDVADISNVPVLQRSMAEMAEKIAEQLSLMEPGNQGSNNGKEDPQYGLFAAAYLTNAVINRYGLKFYHFAYSDEPIADRVEHRYLSTIFGDTLYRRLADNGFSGMGKGNLPDTEAIVQQLLKVAHPFFLEIDTGRSRVLSTWQPLYGRERCVKLPRVELVPHIKACIIGLTEGTLDLSSLGDFLRGTNIREYAGHGTELMPSRPLTPDEISAVERAVAHIPLRAQAQLPNFDRLPKVGDRFEKKDDLWPVDSGKPVKRRASKDAKDGDIWT